MKSSLPILLRIFVLVCPVAIWSQPMLTASAVELSAPIPTFSYIKLKGSDDVNVQYYLTTALAVAAGYDHETAISVGLYNQLLDDQRKTSSSPWLNFKARRQYHFTSAKQREKLWSQFETSPEIPKLSMYLHALQDSVYHQGFGWMLGHMFKGHQPDQSWLPQNFLKNREVVSLTYQKLIGAAPKLQQYQAAIPFENISESATAFLQAASRNEKSEQFRALCSRIEKPVVAEQLLYQMQRAIMMYDSDVNFRRELSKDPAHCKTLFQLQNLQTRRE